METMVITADERAEEVLASLLIKDRDARELIADSVPLEMFITEPSRLIASAVYGIMAEQLEVDQVLLIEKLSPMHDNPAILIELTKQVTVDVGNTDHFIKRVQVNHDKRMKLSLLGDAREELVSGNIEDYGKWVSDIEDRLLREYIERGVEVTTFAKTVEIIERAKREGGIGYSWGIDPRLDKTTGGIVPQRYYAIGGLKKTGKTLFVVHVAASLIKRINPVPVLFVSLEMSRDQLNRAFISNLAQVNAAKFGTEYIDDAAIERCRSAAEILDKSVLHVVDTPGMTTDQIIGAIRRHVRHGVKVVVIDYLQRIDIQNKSDNRATAIQKSVNRLSDAARKYNVALLILSQLANRAEFDESPGVGDFKESGGITEACDCAMILNNLGRKKLVVDADRYKMEIHIPIQRFGISNTKITVKHDFRYARLYPMEEYREER